ncbi:MAG TPA: hypothetical protein P5236_02520, partial [Paludibacteraceae bacterium]|nr:hypothetical protein [Paludibacteraceae bacterium]
MIVKNIYESKSDFVKFSPSEKIVYEMVKKLYQKETETTERIKENSLPQTTLFNCVHTITSKLKEEEYPEAFIDEIWDEIKHIRGKRNDPIKNRPAGDFWGDDYDFHVNRWYEATVIFACVYVIMAIDCPEKVDCLETIKEKCAYNENSTPYFEYFEKSLQDWKKNQERFFESSEIQKDLKENSTNHYSENEWIANEKHVSWEFDNFRKTLVGKSTDEKFRDCLEEYQREQNMPHPNSLYLKLLDREIQYYQRHIAETNSPTIQVNDIISVLQENKFSPAKAVQILEIINYILYARQYPEDICGNIDKKINL